MRIELRQFKHYPSRSEETIAFFGRIYVDGIRVGTAQNSGFGGSTDLVFEHPYLSPHGLRNLRARAGWPDNEDFFFLALAEEIVREKEEAAFIKKARAVKKCPYRVVFGMREDMGAPGEEVMGDLLVAFAPRTPESRLKQWRASLAGSKHLRAGEEIKSVAPLLLRPATVEDSFLLGDIDESERAVWSDYCEENGMIGAMGAAPNAPPPPRRVAKSLSGYQLQALAAQARLKEIAKTRRPTEAEQAEAREAYARAGFV